MTEASRRCRWIGCGYIADSYRELPAAAAEKALRCAASLTATPRVSPPIAHAGATTAMLRWPRRARRSRDEDRHQRHRSGKSCRGDARRARGGQARLFGKAAGHVARPSPSPCAISPRRTGLRLAAAPCSILGEDARPVAAVQQREDRRAPLVYAEIDDGMIHMADYRSWRQPPRPRLARARRIRGRRRLGARGHVLTVLCAMSARCTTSHPFASPLIADKQTDPPCARPAPDFRSACSSSTAAWSPRLADAVRRAVRPQDAGDRGRGLARGQGNLGLRLPGTNSRAV